MLQYRLYNGDPLPSGLQGFLKASANIGSVVGQFAFGAYASDMEIPFHPPRGIHFCFEVSCIPTGTAADYFGRKAVCKFFNYISCTTTDP